MGERVRALGLKVKLHAPLRVGTDPVRQGVLALRRDWLADARAGIAPESIAPGVPGPEGIEVKRFAPA